MINTMIVDDNIDYAKYILNNVINKFQDIKVSYIATGGQESLEILSKNNFDLIFLDLRMPDITGIEVIERLKVMNIVNFPKIIIVSGDIDLIYYIQNTSYISNIINKTESIESVRSKISDTINEIKYSLTFDKIQIQVMKELSQMGYNFKYKGTKYIKETILYIYKQNNMDLLDNLESNVYRVIGIKNKKSVLNIKTNIIKATNIATNYGNKKLGNNYFLADTKLTPKSVISTILTTLSKEYL